MIKVDIISATQNALSGNCAFVSVADQIIIVLFPKLSIIQFGNI